ncbi:MAG: DNA recombination protein RmuC [Minisyncoccia bacterium]
MEILIIILLIAVLGFQIYIFWNKKDAPAAQDTQGLLILQNQIQNLSRSMEENLALSRKELGEGTDQMFNNMRAQFNESQKLVSNVRDFVAERLTEVAREQTKTNEATSKFISIAEQLNNLEKVLTHQKQRGNWGEASLEIVLGGFLPPTAYKMQYGFANGEVVDAAIFTKDGIIPVDAKFSLDNYARLANAVDEIQRQELEKAFKNDLKMRIDETAKYVREKEGTLPIAFMYIPAEAIYYDLLVGEVNQGKVNARNLIDYAYREKHVMIASPTTFMAYLSMVASGLNAFKIEKNFVKIRENIDSLGRHMKSYEDFYKKLGSSLSTTVGHFNSGYKELGKIDKDVLRITGESVGIETMVLDKPQLEGKE